MGCTYRILCIQQGRRHQYGNLWAKNGKKCQKKTYQIGKKGVSTLAIPAKVVFTTLLMSDWKNPTNMTPCDQLFSLCSGCRYIFKAMYTHETPLTLICKLDLANLVHLTEERNIKFSSWSPGVCCVRTVR